MKFATPRSPVRCIAPGCYRRKRSQIALCGVRFCDLACAKTYVEWLRKALEHQENELLSMEHALNEQLGNKFATEPDMLDAQWAKTETEEGDRRVGRC